MEFVNISILFIALAISVFSLVALLCLFLYCRRIDRKCNHYLAKSLCEQSRASHELGRIRKEKEVIEKLLKTKAGVMDEENPVLRIDITFLDKAT